MIIFCVDGLDFDKVGELGRGMMANHRLKVPPECFGPGGQGPHTLKVWATIFTGQVQDKGHFPGRGSRTFNRVGRILARKYGVHIANWGAPMTYPIHARKDNLFDHCDALVWNIPTISPGWLYALNHWAEMVDYSHREFQTFMALAHGAPFLSYQVVALYTRIIDVYGHHHRDTDLYYEYVFDLAELLAKKDDVMVISDHGTTDEGVHTPWAYAGSNFWMDAKSVEDVRADIEDRLNNARARELEDQCYRY